MNKKFVKVVAIIIAAAFLLTICGSLIVSLVYSAPDFTLSGLRQTEAELCESASAVYNLEERLENSEAELQELTARLDDAQLQADETYDRLKNRLQVACEHGSVSYLEMLFSSERFSAFLDSAVTAREIAAYDQAVYEAQVQQQNELAAAKDELETFMANRKNYEEGLKQANETLREKQAAAQEYWAALSEDEAAFDRVMNDEADARETLKRQIAEQASDGISDEASATFWPTDSQDVSREFVQGDTAQAHTGIDIRADFADPVYAMASGRVLIAEQTEGYGNCVVIDHGDGLQTLYGHLSGIGVTAGQEVTAGYRIGIVGATGASDEPYLHFETIFDGESEDPMRHIFSE